MTQVWLKMHKGIKSYGVMNLEPQDAQNVPRLLDQMPDLEGMSRPQLSTLSIFTSSLLLNGFFLHWIHGIKVNKRHKENHKMHQWIPFGLASNMACWTLFCPMPRICNYRSFLILGPLAHVQLVSDTKTRATQHKTTRGFILNSHISCITSHEHHLPKC